MRLYKAKMLLGLTLLGFFLIASIAIQDEIHHHLFRALSIFTILGLMHQTPDFNSKIKNR